MHDIIEIVRQIIRHELSQHAGSALAIVERTHVHAAAGDLANYQCDVRLRGRGARLLGVPVATPRIGMVDPPARDDLVLLVFVAGDPDQPVIVGRLYSDSVRPPLSREGQIKSSTPLGAADDERIDIELDAGRAGKRSVRLTLLPDTSVTVSDTAIEIRTGRCRAVLDGQGAILLEADGDLTLSASGNLVLGARGNVSIEAQGTAELRGAAVNIQ